MKGYDALQNGYSNQAPSAPPPPYDLNFGSQQFHAPPPPPLSTTGQYISAPPLRTNASGHQYSYGLTPNNQTTIHIARAVPIDYRRQEESGCCCCCCSCPFWVCCLIMAALLVLFFIPLF